MKNKIMLVIMTILLAIAIALTIIKVKPYTIKDRDRALDIYLENKKPNIIDYMRLDDELDTTLYDLIKADLVEKVDE
ncbi:hypothetical protein IKS57_02775 [bacterium]|nr:hypothetical protein [bacterium]